MKLPDFRKFEKLVRVKVAMGIPPNQLGDIPAVEVRRAGLTQDNYRKSAEEVLEVEIGDVEPLPDGTLSYNGERVILYIRDVANYGGDYSNPKFHVADCVTLQSMREAQRGSRYVRASRYDGKFQVHYVNDGAWETIRLDVCQHCLRRLDYKGFQRKRKNKRNAAVQEFSIKEFFEVYPKSLHHVMPDYTDLTAPVNDYSPDFSAISRAYRQERNWICEVCGISLSGENMRHFLQVHHINGLKNDNGSGNLKAVCVHCHASEPSHGHLKAMRQYREFEEIWRRWRITGIAP